MEKSLMLLLGLAVVLYLVFSSKVFEKFTLGDALNKVVIPRAPDCLFSGDSVCAESEYGPHCKKGYCSP